MLGWWYLDRKMWLPRWSSERARRARSKRSAIRPQLVLRSSTDVSPACIRKAVRYKRRGWSSLPAYGALCSEKWLEFQYRYLPWNIRFSFLVRWKVFKERTNFWSTLFFGTRATQRTFETRVEFMAACSSGGITKKQILGLSNPKISVTLKSPWLRFRCGTWI